MMGLNSIRRATLPRLHPFTEKLNFPLIREKRPYSDEKIATTTKTTEEIYYLLREAGFRPNPLSTLKFIRHKGGRRYESFSLVHRPSFFSHWQTHIFVFDMGNHRLVFAHYEPSVLRPFRHRGGEHQEPGDPEGLTENIKW